MCVHTFSFLLFSTLTNDVLRLYVVLQFSKILDESVLLSQMK